MNRVIRLEDGSFAIHKMSVITGNGYMSGYYDKDGNLRDYEVFNVCGIECRASKENLSRLELMGRSYKLKES